MLYDITRNGERKSGRRFAAEKRKLFESAIAGSKKEELKDVFRSASYALGTLKKAGTFECDAAGGIYIYDAVLNYLAECAGDVSGAGLASFFGTAEFEREELENLPDFMKTALLERLNEVEENGAEYKALISSERKIEQIDFKKIFFAFCVQSGILENDAVYPYCSERTKEIYLRCLSKYAKRYSLSEKEAAQRAMNEAKKQNTDVGEILLAERKNREKPYYFSIALITAALLLLFFVFVGSPLTAALLALPVGITLYDLSKQISAEFFTRSCGHELVRLSKGESLEKAKCLITIPVILCGKENDSSIFDRLEDFYLRNKSKRYTFSVLGDLGESETKEKESDAETISYAKARISALNAKYEGGFALFIRARVYCDCQNKYLSRERKRGGIEDLCKYVSGEDIPFREVICDRDFFDGCDHLLTLDADTDLPYGAVREMLSIMLHPHNAPVVDGEKRIVVKGHGIIQPSVCCSLSSAERTAFASISSGGGGIDVYSGTGKELYQCISGVGNFCGKGMIDINAYLSVCADRFPDQRILSHDLPEGILLRCGYADDVVLSDSTPKNAVSYFARLNRWMRGDVQSLVLLGKTTGGVMRSEDNPFPSWGKYRIVDNILRHLAPVSALIALVAASFASGSASLAITLFSLGFLFYGTLKRITSSVFSGNIFSRGRTFSELASIGDYFIYFLFRLSALAEESAEFVSSAVKTAWRFAVTKKHFLDWISAAQSDKNGGGVAIFYKRMLSSVLISAVAILLPGAFIKVFAALWAIFPLFMYLFSFEKNYSTRLGKKGKKLITENSRRSWNFFSEYVNAKTNWLPPDNCQLSPVERTAMRTSPTNIGMYLLSALAARDMGFITSVELYERLSATSKTLNKMIRWHGHFYNWYDIRTLEVIGGAFVSSVDSGNFAVSLVTLCEGIKDYVSEYTALLDIIGSYEKILREIDFTALYDDANRLFYVGYDAKTGNYTESRYDVFMSEARLLSYYAVCSGQIPADHYYSPARKLCGGNGKVGVFSWSGTAFEFFMPSLFLPKVRNSLSDKAMRFAAETQKNNGVFKNISGKRVALYGISESQYFHFDGMMNYQYKAFGVGSLALDPEAACENVISPYSSFLMLPYLSFNAAANLKTLKSVGAFGKFGFYEAVDFSAKRVGAGYAIIKSYMSHHLGMAAVASANACRDGIFVDRFMRNENMRAGKILLEERISKRAEITSPKAKRKKDEKPVLYGNIPKEEIKYEHNILSPDVYMLSNNKTRIVASSSGHIAMYDGNVCVFTSGFDRFSIGGGLILEAEADGNLISAVPLGYTDESFDSVFSVKKEEDSITYSSRHQKQGKAIEFSVKIKLRTEHPIADVEAKISPNVKNARIMLYFEPIMQEEKAYVSHKSFSGLFLQSEFDGRENAVIVKRRPRNESGESFCAVKVSGRTKFEFDTGREDLRPGYGIKDVAELIRVPCKSNTAAPMIPAVRIICRKCRNAAISIGFSNNKSDLLYYMEKPDTLTGDALCALQHGAAGLGKSAAAFESFLLRSAYFPMNEPEAADPATIKKLKNVPFDRSGLYRFSISGDNPIVMVNVYRSGGRQSDNIRSFLSLFRYACIRGIRFDLIFLFAENDRYRMNVENHILKLVSDAGCGEFLGADGGIFLIDRDSLGDGEEYSLRRICACTADASIPISVTIKSNRFFVDLSSAAEKSLIKAPVTRGETCGMPEADAVEKTSSGVFHTDGFLGVKSNITVPFALVASSYSLGFVATQNSLGFTFASNSALGKLTPHDADALTEDNGEKLIMRIKDRFGDGFEDFDVCACSAYADYRMGKIIYYGKIKNIKYEISVYADEKLAVKYVDADIDCDEKDVSAELIFLIRPYIGQIRQNNRCRIYENDTDINRCAVKIYPAVAEGNERKTAVMYDGDGKIYTDTAAIKSDGKYFCGTDDIAAIKAECLPKEKRRYSFALAAFRERKDYEYISRSFYSGARSCAGETLLPEVSVKSNDGLFDLFTNKFAFYQCAASRMRARCGYYQVGGAYGFRDQLQDALSLDLKTLKRQIIFCACHQFREGDVMHWWHNVAGDHAHKGIRTRCSDDCAWLLYAFLEYIDRSGELGFADMRLPFLAARPLMKWERERYDTVRFTSDKHPVYAHMLLCARKLCERGIHGMCLIGSHDWNDGMNAVGREGKGESVWLSQFAAGILKRFSEYCIERGDEDSGRCFGKVSLELREAVEKYGFDEDRYLRGYYDDGQKLGGRGSDECEIDVLPQAFAVFEKFERSKTAIDTMMRILYDKDEKLLKLLYPPFDNGEKYPGYIKGYVPGTRENGGQYTHAAIWAAMALIYGGDVKRGTRLLKTLSPAIRTREKALESKYKIEPFVLAGDIYSCGELAGRGGWSWYTGAAGWYRTAVVSALCGYKLQDGGFYLSPALSDEFPAVCLMVNREKTAYEIKIEKCGRNELIFDGEKLDKSCDEVLFMFDGKKHSVILFVK